MDTPKPQKLLQWIFTSILKLVALCKNRIFSIIFHFLSRPYRCCRIFVSTWESFLIFYRKIFWCQVFQMVVFVTGSSKAWKKISLTSGENSSVGVSIGTFPCFWDWFFKKPSSGLLFVLESWKAAKTNNVWIFELIRFFRRSFLCKCKLVFLHQGLNRHSFSRTQTLVSQNGGFCSFRLLIVRKWRITAFGFDLFYKNSTPVSHRTLNDFFDSRSESRSFFDGQIKLKLVDSVPSVEPW